MSSLVSSCIDPLEEPGYEAWLKELPDATAFHTKGWARVLGQTYGHQPFYLAVGHGPQWANVLPLMEVRSAVTGHRGVSLPFTDFCAPPGPEPVADLPSSVIKLGRARGWRHVEFRGLEACQDALGSPSVTFLAHEVDVRPQERGILERCSPAVRRAVRKAIQSGIEVTFESSISGTRAYYELHCITRRRHGLPPQPWKFFERLWQHVFATGLGFVALGHYCKKVVAGAVFLCFQKRGIYKFGASSVEAEPVRANNLVMLEGLKNCAALGCERVHLGRTSELNNGLRRYKLGYSPKEYPLIYHRYDFRQDCFVTTPDRAESRRVKAIFRLLPPPALHWAGRLLYPHLS